MAPKVLLKVVHFMNVLSVMPEKSNDKISSKNGEGRKSDFLRYKILFDGECNLCNASVNFIMKRDKKKKFEYQPIQSVKEGSIPAPALEIVKQLNSILLLEGDKLYTQSTAILRVSKHLGGLVSLLYAFIIVPKFLRDAVYRFIARNRYKWFGKKEFCELP
jgi:predicted DCC family thiol-disulfide oxidoreductase YuxK